MNKMVEILTAITGAGIFLIIVFLVLFVLGFIIKKLKFVLWIIAFLVLLIAVYFIFTG